MILLLIAYAQIPPLHGHAVIYGRDFLTKFYAYVLDFLSQKSSFILLIVSLYHTNFYLLVVLFRTCHFSVLKRHN